MPAQLGFDAGRDYGLLDASLHSGTYSLSIDSPNIVNSNVHGLVVSIWGEPSDPSHDLDRYRSGGVGSPGEEGEPPIPYTGEPKWPFLSPPPPAAVALSRSAISADSWSEPLEAAKRPLTPFAWTDQRDDPISLGGCNQLNFDPTIESQPTTDLADSPRASTSTSTSPSETPGTEWPRPGPPPRHHRHLPGLAS